MKEFRECWLPNDWEQIICIAMLGTHLDPKIHCFETWAAQIMSHNIVRTLILLGLEYA